jgi:hypothetical protein
MFYYFYCLKLLFPPPNDQPISFSLRNLLMLGVEEIKYIQKIMLYLKKQLFINEDSNNKAILVLLFDWLSALYPPCLDSDSLTHLSRNLNSKNVDSDVFLLTAQFFLKLMTRIKRNASKKNSNSNRKTTSELSGGSDKFSENNFTNKIHVKKQSLRNIFMESKFLSNLAKTMRFIDDQKFKAVNFYDDKIRNVNQANFRFCLELLVKYCSVFGNVNGTYTEIFLFIERHFQRIQTVLGLSQISQVKKADLAPKKSLFSGYDPFNDDQVINYSP